MQMTFPEWYEKALATMNNDSNIEREHFYLQLGTGLAATS